MDTKKIIKIIALNLGIVVVDILLFSEGFLDIEIGGKSAFQSALGVTAILMSVVVFAVGNNKLLFQRKQVIHTNEIRTMEDCIYALKENAVKKTFSREIPNILEQTSWFNKKKITINEILLQKFSSGEMSYSKFEGAIREIEKVFYLNIKSILNKINAFDEEDYFRIRNDHDQNKFSNEFIQTKMNIYNEYILFVKEAIEDNEQILLKLDKLLLEISKFNSLEDGEIENMDAMKEIDELISKTKLYK